MAPASSDIRVGDELELVRTVDAYRALYYAAASGDFNPIHLDPEVGRQAGLGGCILQGLCTMAWMVEAVVQLVGDPSRIVHSRVRFSRPVAIGDTLTFRGKVVALETGRMTVEVAAVNQRGEDVLKGGVVQARLDGGAR